MPGVRGSMCTKQRWWRVCGCRARSPTTRHAETKTFATTLQGLEALAAWLTAHEVTHVAMESTGVYWRPGVCRPGGRGGGAVGERAAREDAAGPQDRCARL